MSKKDVNIEKRKDRRKMKRDINKYIDAANRGEDEWILTPKGLLPRKYWTDINRS